MRRQFGVPVLVLVLVAIALTGPQPASASGAWTWPVSGPLIRAFDPPASPYGSGHRGIDIAIRLGSPVLAPAPARVAFAGKVAGHLFVTLDHGGGLESTYSWLLSILVKKGDLVNASDVIATSGPGHPVDVIPNLHLGVKLHDVYVDPLDYLGPVSVSGYIRLAG
jgi:murein DD-endopeptidase MepM/ murein hydrolase activator NlpD